MPGRSNAKNLRKAQKIAKISALERFISGEQLMQRQYDECLRPQIDSQIDEYIQNVETLRKDYDRSMRQLSMTVKATINVARLRNHFSSCSTERGRIAFVFIACEDLGGDRYRPMRSNSSIEQSISETFLNNGYRPIDGMRMGEYNERYRRSDLGNSVCQQKRTDPLQRSTESRRTAGHRLLCLRDLLRPPHRR